MVNHTKSHSCNSPHLHDVHGTNVNVINQRLQAAQTHCHRQGVRFTTLRRQVYELILGAQQPLGAYDLIAKLQQSRQDSAAIADSASSDVSSNNKSSSSSNLNTDSTHKKASKPVAPPTVYRTLEFLLAQGFIHQLTSINAFVPCCHPRDQHAAAFLICERCARVQECSSLPVQDMLGFAKNEMGFMVSHSVIELSGLCDQCQPLSDSTGSKDSPVIDTQHDNKHQHHETMTDTRAGASTTQISDTQVKTNGQN